MQLKPHYAHDAGRYYIKSAEHYGYHHDKAHGAFYACIGKCAWNGKPVGYVCHQNAQYKGNPRSEPQSGNVLIVKPCGLVRLHLLAEIFRLVTRLAESHLTLFYLHCDKCKRAYHGNGDGFAERFRLFASLLLFRRLGFNDGVIGVGGIFVAGFLIYARAFVKLGFRFLLMIVGNLVAHLCLLCGRYGRLKGLSGKRSFLLAQLCRLRFGLRRFPYRLRLYNATLRPGRMLKLGNYALDLIKL